LLDICHVLLRRFDRDGVSSIAVAVIVAACASFVAAAADAQQVVEQDLVLTEDHVGPLWIMTSGVTVDCKNFRVIEPYPVDQENQNTPGTGRAGILISNVTDVTVQNCDIEDFWFGILVVTSSGVNLIGNTVIENSQPMDGWTVRNAFRIEGSNDNALIGNTEAETNGDGFVIVGSTNHHFSGNSAGGGGYGYWLLSAHDNEFLNNTVTGPGGGDGFQVHESNGNRLIANSISGRGAGVRIQTGSAGNAVRANSITDSTSGILVCPELVDLNALSPNRFRDNDVDIEEGGDSCAP